MTHGKSLRILEKKSTDNFLIFLSCSITLHLFVVYFFVFGLPSLFEKLPEEQIIAFEMLQISDKPNVITQKKQKETSVENADAKKSEQSKPKASEDQDLPDNKTHVEEKPKPEPKPKEEEIKPPPPMEEKKPQEKHETLPEEKPQAREEKKPIEEKKPEEKKAAVVKKPEVKAKEIKKKDKNTDELDSLLKNLEQSSEGNNIKSNKYKRSKQLDNERESKGSYNEELPLSMSEAALIKRQIEQHWNNIPAGARNNSKVKIIVNITLDKSGNVERVEIKEKICPNIDASVCEALADTATRAVWQASPIENLDLSRFNYWKEINFSFDPSKL